MCVGKQGDRVGLALCLLLASGPRLAAAAAVTEDLFFDDLPPIVTVTRLAQSPLELPAAVTIIDRPMIEASGVVEIPDLLRLAAGFQVGHPYGTRAAVTYHGMTDQYAPRMQVLVDGRSVYSPVFGGVEWPLLPLALEDIERIEVTRGPNGVTYGANSFLGVINIITVHPGAIEQSAYGKVIGEAGGTFHKAVVRQGGSRGDFNYYLTLEHRWDAGLDDREPNGIKQEYDESRINQLRFRSEYRAAINDYLDIQFGINDAQLGSGKANDPTSQVRMTDNLSHFQQLGWRHLGSAQQETQLLFYHDYNDLQDSYQTAPLSAIFNVDPALVEALLGVPDQPAAVDMTRTSERFNLELQHRYRIAPTLRAVSGIEARLDRVHAPGLLVQNERIDSELYRLFTNGEWQAKPQWLVNGGALLEYQHAYGTLLSPRLALNYRVNQTQAIRASYSRAYRTPSILDRYADVASTFAYDGGVIDEILKGSTDLTPERIDAWELGLAGEHAGGLGYDLKLFREKMTNLITVAGEDNPTDPNCALYPIVNYENFCRANFYSNAGEGVTTGAELQLDYRPNPRQMVSLAWSHLFQREGEILFAKYITGDIYGSMESWRPEDTVTLLAQQGIGNGVSLSVLVHHVDSWLSVGNTNNVRFTTANARLNKQFRVGGVSGSLSFWVNGLLGSYYDFYYFSPTTPRSYLGLELAF